MMGLRYSVDGRVFLDRRRRAKAVMDHVMSGEPFDKLAVLRDWSEVANEVGEIPFETGPRYRIRVIAGEAATRHMHLENERTGDVVGVDLPVEIDPSFQEFVLTYIGRSARLPNGGSSILFAMEDGRTALLGDIDILEAEELP